MTCAIIGDSIAVLLAMTHPGCDVSAKVGRTPAQIAAHPVAGSFDWAVISAGSNNTPGRPMRAELDRIRARINARRVVWVLPANPQNRRAVTADAGSHGDPMVSFVAGRDGIHPRSGRAVWRSMRDALDGAQ